MSRSATTPLGGLRVLVADDEVFISQFIGELLRHLECTVVGPVRSSEEAVRAIRTNEIDGALLDLNLGETSAYPAANELAGRDILFILMTGERHLGAFPALLANAPRLSKPFRVRDLEEMMTRTFGRPDHGASNPA